MEVGAHEQRTATAEERVGEGLVWIRSRKHDAALQRRGMRGHIRATESPHAERRLKNERGAHADLAGGAPKALHVVAIRRLHADAGVPVQNSTPYVSPRVPNRFPTNAGDRSPRPRLDRPRIVPQPPVHVADVVHRHPDRIEPGVTIGAEGEVLFERSVGVERDAGSSFDAPEGRAGLGAQHRMADRIAEPEVAAEPVRSGLVERIRDERHVLLETAEIILATAQRSRPAAVSVVPDDRQEAGDDAVAAGRFARGIIHLQQALAPALEGALLTIVERVPIVGSLPRVENQAARLVIRDELDALALGLSGRASVNVSLVADLERHPAVAQDVAQLFVEKLSLRVDHRVVGQKVAVAFADHRDRLAPAVQVPEQDFAFDIGVAGALAVRLEEPARLKTREPFVEIALTPLVVGEHAHRVIVAELVDDQTEAGPTVHDHHRELRAAALDAMHVRDLRPAELAVQRVEPRERHLGAVNRYPVAPRRTVAGLVKDVDDDVAIAALFVSIGGVQREREVMNGVGKEPDAFSTDLRPSAPGSGEWGVVPIALIVDRPHRDRRLFPTGITLNRYARGPDDLVCGQIEHHVVAREFAVELAGWIERMIFPPIAVVDDDLRIPLREIEPAALPSLAPR